MITTCLISSAATFGFLYLLPRIANYLHQILGEKRLAAFESRIEPVLPWLLGAEVACMGCLASLKFELLDSAANSIALGLGFGLLGFLAACATIQDMKTGEARSSNAPDLDI